MARKSEEAKLITKQARQQRRRDTYQKKRAAAKKAKEDLEDDDEDIMDDEGEQQPMVVAEPTPMPSSKDKDEGEPEAKKTRQETITEIMGNVSDISSDKTEDSTGNVAYKVTGVSQANNQQHFPNATLITQIDRREQWFSLKTLTRRQARTKGLQVLKLQELTRQSRLLLDLWPLGSS